MKQGLQLMRKAKASPHAESGFRYTNAYINKGYAIKLHCDPNEKGSTAKSAGPNKCPLFIIGVVIISPTTWRLYCRFGDNEFYHIALALSTTLLVKELGLAQHFPAKRYHYPIQSCF